MFVLGGPLLFPIRVVMPTASILPAVCPLACCVDQKPVQQTMKVYLRQPKFVPQLKEVVTSLVPLLYQCFPLLAQALVQLCVEMSQGNNPG